MNCDSFVLILVVVDNGLVLDVIDEYRELN